jgi:hypothetical protein
MLLRKILGPADDCDPGFFGLNNSLDHLSISLDKDRHISDSLGYLKFVKSSLEVVFIE